MSAYRDSTKAVTPSDESPTISTNFKSPLPEHPHLRIQIPSSNESLHSSIESSNDFSAPSVLPKLGEPLSFSPTLDSPSKASFERITQLPTPVLNNGSFTSTSFVSGSPSESITLEIEKNRSPKYTHHKYDTSPRVISDYKPIPALGRKNSLLDHSNTLVASKRIVSNPIRSSPITNSSTPTPPPTTPPSYLKLFPKDEEKKPHKYFGKIFNAPRLGKDYEFVKEVGSGNFSTVILTRSITDSSLIAIKVIHFPSEENQIPNFRSFLRRELNILYQVSHHPCITQLVDYSVTFNLPRQEIESPCLIDSEDIDHDDIDFYKLMENNNQLIFLKYCPGGNLLQFFIDHKQAYNIHNLHYWIIIKRIICELLITVNYLHTNDIIHRDIKLENILLNFSFTEMDQLIQFNNSEEIPVFINLSDFGLSKKLKSPDQLLSTRCGSQDYISPEILMGVKYDGKLTDAWSVGVLIYSILEGRLPFDLPPIDALTAQGISPSVIRRRRSKNSAAHRIAMIDWDWFKVNEYSSDSTVNPDIKQIFTELKSIVDHVLVRKDKRSTIGELLVNRDFGWIKQFLPHHLTNAN
ncbi:kinase-like domain-containing protein [Scheffersomyces amazonensis]|uniref:kinase-like domain-containing protein n=1 Tax=Scheffersomyces amazonensis TaxID=1078765 RepID=UPI00315D7357